MFAALTADGCLAVFGRMYGAGTRRPILLPSGPAGLAYVCIGQTRGPLGRSMRKAWKNPTVGGPVFQQHHSLITDFLETSHPLYHMAQMTYQLSRLKSSNL